MFPRMIHRRCIAVLVILAVAASFAMLAASALAIPKSNAAAILKSATHAFAACGQGWNCSFYQQLDLNNTGALNPQWLGTGYLWRQNGRNVQGCSLGLSIDSNGALNDVGQISCINIAR